MSLQLHGKTEVRVIGSFLQSCVLGRESPLFQKQEDVASIPKKKSLKILKGPQSRNIQEKPYCKTAIKKVMTVLEMELQGAQCSLMGPNTYLWLRAPALSKRAEDFDEHEETFPLQQALENVHNCCQQPIYHRTPHY